jgi:nucleoprotein TPR
LLRQQLRDLSSQIKMLLAEEQYRERGLEELTADERLEIERKARGEQGGWTQNESDTNQLISLRLVIYRNVSEMQEKNEQLLKVVRELGDRMEGEEAQKKAAESAANAQEVEELRHQVSRYKDELQATAAQIDSYVKERDMFRRMLQRRGDLHPDVDLQAMFGQSVPPATPQRNGAEMIAQTPRSKDVEDLNKILKEQQTFFDQYRNESSQDRKVLKDQVDALGRDKSALQADIAHWKSQKTLSDERLQMLQTNFNGLRNENSELQKRTQQMSENAAKQDLRTQQVAEELVEARSMADSLRNENANTKAEKELWKRIESRLTEDNKNLMDERSRLNKLVADLQSLQNERELSDSETRRRLQSRVESLESELTDTKKKLEQEAEDGRKSTLRREYDESQSRTRIDDLVKSLGNVREELVAAKTTRDSLQSRVDEMKIELRSAEERVAALQPRPTPRAQPQQNGEQEQNGDDELSSEQCFALQVSDLKRDLELARNELEAAKQQVEQYRVIAQGTEDELASFTETSDQYKEETDRQIAEKDARANELQQRVDDLLAELTTTNNELSELRSKHDDSDRILNEQKTSFEGELARLRDDAERHATEKTLYQQDLKAQAEIAQQAQQSYEDELLKHAEAAKNLQSVRKEYNELRTEVAGVRAEAEAAKVSLEQAEESWSEQREKFEHELDEAKRRKQDVDEQNRLLYQQMESFSTELSTLRSGRAVPAGDGEERSGTPSGDGNMQEVVKYLRREKEIVDVQYELSMQESKRLQQQLEYANSQLEETRQKLAEERRQSANKMASESSTQKLAETINQLNLYRESATTLRNEAHQYREKLEEKSKELERLVAEVEPLKGRVGELEGELESKDGEMKLLQDDRNHWRERTQNIISKYDRVDPAELEDLRKQLEDLKAEKERLETEQAPLREQVENADKQIEEAKDEVSKPLNAKLEAFRTQAKEQNRKQVERIREIQGSLDAANAENAKVADELEQIKAALQEAQSNAASSKNMDNEEGQVDESGDFEDKEALRTRVAEAEASANEHASRADSLNAEVQTLQARVTELEGQIITLQAQLDNALQGEEGEIQQTGTADSEALENLRQELATAQQEVENLRANASNTGAAGTQLSSGETTGAEQVKQELAKLRSELEQQHELAKKQVEEERDRRIENMKGQLNKKLKEDREKIRESVRQELVEEHSTELQKLRDEYEATITKLKEEHQAELERLAREGGAAVQKAEGASGTTSTEQEWPTEQQILESIKSNQRVRGIFNNNLTKRVNAETEKLQKTIAAKDEEISQLKEAQTTATGDEEKDELQKKLDAAEEDKKEAVRNAVEQESKKAKVQVSMLGIAQAKVGVVRKAAQETPDKPVKEVWDVADKARPAPPKPTTGGAPPSSPATAAPKPATEPPAVSAQPSSDASAPSQDLTEEEKIRLRQERFGTGSPTAALQPPARTGSFGQPSAPVSGIPAPGAGGTFGRPSQVGTTGAMGQPARRPSMTNNTGAPNPQAATFTPTGTGPAALRGLAQGSLPRPGGARQGSNQFQIQGAAAQQNPTPATGAPRGGAQGSGIPRGGGNIPRGGRGGVQRGGGGNAGQKRPHEGGDAGDGKRMRGGGPGGP